MRILNYLQGVLGVAALAVVANAAPVTTATFTVVDSGDTVSVTDDNSTGRLFACTPAVESCFFNISPFTGLGGTNSITISYNGIVFTNINAVGINLLEPGTGAVSDTLTLTDTSGIHGTKTFWQFNSDSDSGSAPTALTDPSLTEDGTAQPTIVIDYFNVDQTHIARDIIQLQSDVETPEASSILTVFTGLALIGVLFVRRRAASRVH
jgi:hypothetical protein